MYDGRDVVVHNADNFRVRRLTGKVFLSALCVKRLIQCLQKVNHSVVGPLRSRLVPKKTAVYRVEWLSVLISNHYRIGGREDIPNNWGE